MSVSSLVTSYLYFSPLNFPIEDPIGEELYVLVKDIARCYLVLGVASQKTFLAKDSSDYYM